MAKANKKAVKKVSTKTEDNAVKATALLRKGALAYVGMYGAAYERAQFRFNQAREATDGLFETFVEKGEEIEAQASDYLKGTQTAVVKTYKENSEKVRSILPASANDRVEELEAEIAALNKKIVAMGKKATAAVKAKTEKTVAAATEAEKAA